MSHRRSRVRAPSAPPEPALRDASPGFACLGRRSRCLFQADPGEILTTRYHDPVLAGVIRTWAAGSTCAVDATAGGGGHTLILKESGARVLAIDRDPEALVEARARVGDDGVTWLAAPFAAKEALAAVRAFKPDRILLDLGVSSHQIDAEGRGFTFRPGAALDMRMTPDVGATAADILNTWGEERLEQTFAEDADEPKARRLARSIVRRRQRGPFMTSDDFVNAIREVLGPRSGPPDFARAFQALRMAVNGEKEQLTSALPAFRDALLPGGRLGVIAYHSGEDRIVKHAFREWARECICPPGQPVCTCRGHALGLLRTRKAVSPGPEEVAANPRSRSAHFRDFEVTPG
ncbi:MAG TPA: 16S rRNA (cytosine(1402)-N(4))-methyltransferase RsmH [Gemmatimonadales bacterium]|nr:16S rRNA (cytosine(1402)-N(4))-methyltransferase RsmH [Gemmatimonadales bacterium]